MRKAKNMIAFQCKKLMKFLKFWRREKDLEVYKEY